MKYTIYSLLLFLSGALNGQIDHWESVVLAENVWQYRSGSSAITTDWNQLDFDDGTWSSGAGSIGYGDDDDLTVIGIVQSLYMRKTFDIVDISSIEEMIFHADFDDGFVAYLNGVEIARNNITGNPPTYNQDAITFREAQLYQGGSPILFNLLDWQNILQEGENVLAIQTHNFDGFNSSDFTTLYWLSAGINDNSNNYQATPTWFVQPGFTSNLPIIQINTFGQYIPDEPNIPAEMGIIWNGDDALNFSLEEANEFLGNISIERRGQSSLDLFPKNGYKIETKDAEGIDIDTSFLGFPAEEDWILHGPYSDKTMMRNVIVMHISNKMGQYASRTKFVEVVINGQYEGIYVLMEKIKRDNNRVDVANLNPEDISGDELTGGYIIKVDKEEFDWFSQYNMQNNNFDKLRYTMVYPQSEDILEVQKNYIQSYVDSFENAAASFTLFYGGKRYNEYIDITSFAEHLIISELTQNVDAYRISSYFYKDKNSNGGLLKSGPVWDYNLGFGNVDYCVQAQTNEWLYEETCGIFNPFWWQRMASDEVFQNEVKCRWEDNRKGGLHLDSLFAFIDENAAILEAQGAIERNFLRWPTLGEYIWPNPFIFDTYEEEVNYLKNTIQGRIEWMDDHIFGECLTQVSAPSIAEANYEVMVFPNPTVDEIAVRFKQELNQTAKLTISNILGNVVYKEDIKSTVIEHRLTVTHFPMGMYVVKIVDDNGRTAIAKFLIER